MIAFVVVLVVAIVCIGVYLWVTDPEWLRSQAEAEIQMYAARRSRELDELRQAMRRDTQRLRYEFDAELRELDE